MIPPYYMILVVHDLLSPNGIYGDERNIISRQGMYDFQCYLA